MQLPRASGGNPPPPGCLGANPSRCPRRPRAPQLRLQHRSHLRMSEGSVPAETRGVGVRPTPPRHPRSARRCYRPARAWSWGGCRWAGGAGGAPGGDAGPGGQTGAAPAGWGCARGACPACGPAGDVPWAEASACRWRARARVSSGTAGAWGRCRPWLPAGSGPLLLALPPLPQLGGWWAAERFVGVFWGPSSPAPRDAGAAAHGRAPPPPCRSRGAACVPSTSGAPRSLHRGHRLPPVHLLAPRVPWHPQPLGSGLGGTAGSPGDPPQQHRPCTHLQNGPEGWGAGRRPGWL